MEPAWLILAPAAFEMLTTVLSDVTNVATSEKRHRKDQSGVY